MANIFSYSFSLFQPRRTTFMSGDGNIMTSLRMAAFELFPHSLCFRF
jgi:hypothetical protein